MDETAEKRRSIGARRNPQTQEAVLAAAEAILIEAGLAGFSIEAVARKARAGKPTIYRWWPNKTALLLDVYQHRKPPTVHADTGNIEKDVELFLTRLLAHWRHDGAGEVFRVILAEAQRDAEASKGLQAYAEERRRQTGAMFERAIARGELGEDIDPFLAAEMLSGLAWQRLLTGRLDMPAEEIRAAARQLVRGLTAPAHK